MTNQHYIKEFKQRHGLKGVDMASIIGVKPQTLRVKMCGGRAVTDSDIEKLQEWERKRQ